MKSKRILLDTVWEAQVSCANGINQTNHCTNKKRPCTTTLKMNFLSSLVLSCLLLSSLLLSFLSSSVFSPLPVPVFFLCLSLSLSLSPCGVVVVMCCVVLCCVVLCFVVLCVLCVLMCVLVCDTLRNSVCPLNTSPCVPGTTRICVSTCVRVVPVQTVRF